MRKIEREGDTDPSVLEGRCIDGQDVGATARKCSFEDDDRWIFSMPGHDQDHHSSTRRNRHRMTRIPGDDGVAVVGGSSRRRAGGTLLLREDDLVVVVAPGRRAVATANEASDDIEAFDLAVLEVAKAEHRARLLLSQLVHGLSFW